MKKNLIFPIVFFLIGCSSPEAETVNDSTEKQTVIESRV